jgi:hypothetical protein
VASLLGNPFSPLYSYIPTAFPLAPAPSSGYLGGGDHEDFAPGKKSVEINFNTVILKGHFIGNPKGVSLRSMGGHIRGVIRLAGLHEHRMASRSAPANLAKYEMILVSLFFHVAFSFFGNFNFFHLYPSYNERDLPNSI